MLAIQNSLVFDNCSRVQLLLLSYWHKSRASTFENTEIVTTPAASVTARAPESLVMNANGGSVPLPFHRQHVSVRKANSIMCTENEENSQSVALCKAVDCNTLTVSQNGEAEIRRY